jgi:hypothetical protein
VSRDCMDKLGINGNQNMGIKGFNSGSVSDNKVCLDSSAGQSDSLVSCRSRVRIPPEAPFCTTPEQSSGIFALIT